MMVMDEGDGRWRWTMAMDDGDGQKLRERLD
jgi:hypothetical protein